MAPDSASCPLCEQPVPEPQNYAGRDALEFRCARCGTYRLDGTVPYVLPNREDLRGKRHILSGLTRRASDRRKPLFITERDLDQLITLASEPRTPHEAIDRLLLILHERSPDLQGIAPFDYSIDYPLLFVRDQATAEWIAEQAIGRGLFQRGRGTDLLHGSGFRHQITLQGWERIDELRKVGARSDQAFVAMSFHPELNEARTAGFIPALEATGYRPVILTDYEHNELIDDVILSEIRRSGLVIVDFTRHAGGAYFEAGFAMGLGIPVIRTCRTSDFTELHFDVNHYNVIKWEAPADLREQLERRIRATVPGRATAGPSTVAR